MLIYPQDIKEKLGIDQLFELVRIKCKSDYGVEFLEKARPSARVADIDKWLEQTAEMLRVLSSGDNLPSRDFQDLRVFIKKMRVKGTFLQAEDFATLKSLLTLLYEWTQYLKKNQTEYPELCSLTYGFIADTTLIRSIEEIVDDKGQVRDTASPELASIRAMLIQKEKAVRVAINKVLRKAIQDQFTDEDSSVTIRDGRLVIPVKAEYKRRIQGFVHDESATGQTVYLEPTEALQLNNEVRELQYQERREIARILIRLTDLVRESAEDLEKGSVFIGLLDFIHAKASFAREIEAVKPQVSKNPIIKWYQAYHPLLWLSHRESGKPTIPLSLELSRQDNRVLVISGPNAGGKSVALKTVGLLQYMFQCGFLIPVGEASTFGVFRSIFLDIGDTQSLENDLSTYSSHLTSMKYFHEMADRNSLFLIDEFGTGTEPQFGGAIAESLLEQLTSRKAFGVVTTHYQNLKKFAENTAEVVNGAMKYDVSALEPLFELEVGKPGSSFAFEIAKKIGLPEKIIENAKGLVGTSQVDYEHLLNSLEKERGSYEKLTKKLKKEEKSIAQIKTDYESLKEMLEDDRKRIIKEAKGKARQIVEEANQRIERTIREIKEHKAEKERTKKLRSNLEAYKSKQKKEEEQAAKRKKQEDLKPGDAITIEGQDTTGEIMHIKGKQAQVRFGNIISFIDLKRLSKTSNRQLKAQEKKSKKIGGINMVDKMAQFNSEIDIRGMRAEEALLKVDEYIDQALLLGSDQVRIIHGKGHGILRDVVRTHLKGHSAVSAMADEHIEMGGSGITLVTLG
ncbi:endonuclease MutS2 [Marinoscillum furvescens]|uniref:Endonuclease MutS2 n=1 Tax=Marinoscillum furvescens DSM 4134 TaxID=1122208 RepID=A0A3D9L4F7_MARFU|nr:endonuclease MutS2 [Marinoscillum furvescens]RED97517.1 DNA mismatch repair protein MutS2 [Marinoscillum furvescens DSM 4134]